MTTILIKSPSEINPLRKHKLQADYTSVFSRESDRRIKNDIKNDLIFLRSISPDYDERKELGKMIISLNYSR